ncbi:MAG: hypothetical protein AAGA42_17200 [Actinomycetota bacterium]
MITLTLIGGLLTAAAFSVVVIASWRVHPEVWVGDITKGEEKTEPTPANISWFLAVMVTMVVGTAATAWVAVVDFDAGFFQRFVVAWCVMAIVSLVDLVVIDIVIFMWWRPASLTLEGYDIPLEYRMHVVGALKGLFYGVPIALVAAAVSALA